MIFDAHTHVWETWPYDPPEPDPNSRAHAEQLLYEMDGAGVERAIVICARIGENPHNVDYAFEAAMRHSGRLVVFPDLECRWSAEYRTPGARHRLAQALARWDFTGFTVYLDEAEDGERLTGEESDAFFALASERRLLLSLSVVPHQMPAVIALAGRFPNLTILLHHFGFVGPRTAATTPNGLELVLAAARCPNVHIKFSGMGNVAAPEQEYPYPELRHIPAQLTAAFGTRRMLWGSDYPVSRRHMTYRQTLSQVSGSGLFSGDEHDLVLGGNLARLLAPQREFSGVQTRALHFGESK